jgi:hypothetical protein
MTGQCSHIFVFFFAFAFLCLCLFSLPLQQISKQKVHLEAHPLTSDLQLHERQTEAEKQTENKRRAVVSTTQRRPKHSERRKPKKVAISDHGYVVNNAIIGLKRAIMA